MNRRSLLSRRGFLKRCAAVVGATAVAGVVKVEIAEPETWCSDPEWLAGEYGVSPAMRHLEDQRELNRLLYQRMASPKLTRRWRGVSLDAMTSTVKL